MKPSMSLFVMPKPAAAVMYGVLLECVMWLPQPWNLCPSIDFDSDEITRQPLTPRVNSMEPIIDTLALSKFSNVIAMEIGFRLVIKSFSLCRVETFRIFCRK